MRRHFLGHLYPVWLNFRGGKGSRPSWHVTGLDWRLGLAACAIWLATALLTRISSLSALVAAAFVARDRAVAGRPASLALVTGFMAVLIFIRHSANIARIRTGTEPKIGKKS